MLLRIWKKLSTNYWIFFGIIFSGLLIQLILFSRLLLWIENRKGFQFTDPLLSLFPPIDLTWLTFGVMYVSIIYCIFILRNQPRAILELLLSYFFLNSLRAITLWLMPLEAPATIIELEDPIVKLIASQIVLKKDLFFSGHTSTLFLLGLSATGNSRVILFILTAFVAFTILAQHVHYTIDIVVAPFISFACFRLAQKIIQQIQITEENAPV